MDTQGLTAEDFAIPVPILQTALPTEASAKVGVAEPLPAVPASRPYPMEDSNIATEYREGVLDMIVDGGMGNGVLRVDNFHASNKDIYVSSTQIRRFGLKEGDLVGGQTRLPKPNERFYGLLKVEKINGVSVEELGIGALTPDMSAPGGRRDFEKMTAIYPNIMLKLETGKTPLSARMIDLLAPIGKGQRGLIVSPPKAGKTTILKDIANGLTTNYPGVHLMAVLIGERPEEVTDVKRSIKGEVAASNFDEDAQSQVRVAELALQRAKRLTELGKDVVLLLDSITRLARAYNMALSTSGRTMSGGFDASAMFPPKKFLGAARCFEEGGSLTIIGTCLIETGSRMDDLIYEEFKGTGNMELHLVRRLADRRVFPAIDAVRSGTRHEELLIGEKDMPLIVRLRRMLDMLSDDERTEALIDRLNKSESNKEFLEMLTKQQS